MVVTCNSFGVSGMDGYKVELEASMYNGTREFDMVGLPDAAVRESKVHGHMCGRISESAVF